MRRPACRSSRSLSRERESSPLYLLVGPEAPPARTDALREAGVRIVEVPSGSGGVDIE